MKKEYWYLLGGLLAGIYVWPRVGIKLPGQG